MSSFSKSCSTPVDARSCSAMRSAYLLAAGAAAVAATTSQAEIIYSGSQNIGISQFSSLNLNLDGDAYGDVLLKNYVFSGGNYMGATVNFFPGKLVSFFSASNYAYASSLAAGFLIDSASVGPSFFGSMAFGASNPNAQFNNAQNAFLGLSFATGGGTRYGWVRLSIDNSAGTFTVHDWAYENSGAGIHAGAVPAPGALGLLAAGATGLGILRGRKRQD